MPLKSTIVKQRVPHNQVDKWIVATYDLHLQSNSLDYSLSQIHSDCDEIIDQGYIDMNFNIPHSTEAVWFLITMSYAIKMLDSIKDFM